MKYFLFTLSIVVTSIAVEGQIGRLALSPQQTIQQNIAKTDITIIYSRPQKKDREIFGTLVPYGEYWRTGANRNTTIEFSQAVVIGEINVKKGKYTIITKPMKSSWDFMLYADTDNWGIPSTLDAEKIICTISVPVKMHAQSFEAFTISIGDFTNYKFDLDIQWDKTAVSIPVGLTTKKQMKKLIDNELLGPQANDFMTAAVYQLESEKEFGTGLDWINKAIKMRKEKSWYDYRVKALILYELKQYDEMKIAIQAGSALAQKTNDEYGNSEFARIRELIK